MTDDFDPQGWIEDQLERRARYLELIAGDMHRLPTQRADARRKAADLRDSVSSVKSLTPDLLDKLEERLRSEDASFAFAEFQELSDHVDRLIGPGEPHGTRSLSGWRPRGNL